MRDIKTWIVTNGAAGFEVQALGVAEALGVEAIVKRVGQSAPWCWIAPWGPVVGTGDIVPPWPDLVIASGRQSIPFARMIRRRSRGRTFVAVLQNPRVPPKWFDFVWAPAHDRLRGANVFSTVVSPHRLTPERLANEARRIAPEIAHLPRPRIAVLLGGTNAVFRFDKRAAGLLGEQLCDVAKRFGAGLMVTPSRRTGKPQADIIRERIKAVPAVMWNGEGANPYFGYLGSADVVLVTCDSVNMVGEAAATGKPAYVVELAGGSAKWRRFLDAMYASGAERPFKGVIESWTYQPPNPTHAIADAIAQAMKKRKVRRAESVG
ncbi:MAG: mitochondrial fission ELM1 family protein [Rhizomicrobium sp.]